LSGRPPMRIVVTGGAGFVGSNLAERLLNDGHQVTVVDNLSGGSLDFLGGCLANSRFRFEQQDLLNLDALPGIFEGHDAVFHLAANSNIPEGRRKSDIDLRLGTLATYNVLEAMRRAGVKEIAFSSSSVVYGEPVVTPTPEDYGPLLPISLYGASKLACEGLVSAFCHNYGFQAWVYRFANICGPHTTHGILFDFMRKLRTNPRQLEILGDGRQAKPYLHVSECVDGMLYLWRQVRDRQLICCNLGCPGATNTDAIARFVVDAMELRGVEFHHTGGPRGWPGDVSQVRLDCARLNSLGWAAKHSSDEAIRLAACEVVQELTCRWSS
jgi:UDP-glucose 4-epimerase